MHSRHRIPASILALFTAVSAICILPTAIWAEDEPMGVERIARLVYPGYESPKATRDDETRWVQVDLGVSREINVVKLFPMIDWGCNSVAFPVRFRIDASNDPKFETFKLVADRSTADFAPPGDKVSIFKCSGVSGRYVRLTVLKTREQRFVLAKIEVWSGGKEVAVGCPSADSAHGDLGKINLTRHPRPQGDGDVTDNRANVIPAKLWKPVPYKAQAPLSGVALDDGVFKDAMKNNIGYLLTSFTVDELLRPFRERAGKPQPSGMRPPIGFWDTDLPGSNAGRFLMGAGNTLRWMDDPELRDRLNQVVDGIEDCRQPDGFIMGYPENTIFYSERAAYTRSWLTHGLIEAGYSGNPKAFGLLRGFYDWFDHCLYLPELLRRGGQGVQGMIANTRMYFTPVGKAEDLQVIQRYFQENYWLKELTERDPRAIWQYPYDHPHNYLITSLEPYLDLYRATGAKKYLNAAEGGWYLYRTCWEHVGGVISICEGDSYPPHSNYLHRHTGELCGNVFWSKYNQRFHLLAPEQERYVTEMEKSIYNVALANQVSSKGLRYHANLEGKKDTSMPICTNSCCEGQGTRFIGSLPEYLYSIATDGLYVDIYAGSDIQWKLGSETVGLKMTTHFPYENGVRLQLTVLHPLRFKLRMRVPSYCAADMPISVNGKPLIIGKPGTYAILDRKWSNKDTVTFTLPVKLRLTRYQGADRLPNGDRYALEYGPVLMALVGPMDEQRGTVLGTTPKGLLSESKPVAGQPLHFTLAGDDRFEYMPYWQVQDQVFTCFPTLPNGSSANLEAPGKDDLALASRGSTAASDSEYAQERGCTSKVIDGIVAVPSDFSNRWHSSLDTPHPHWVEVLLQRPETMDRVVIRFADPSGYPVSFKGLARVNGKFRTLFDVRNYDNMLSYQCKFKAMRADAFRLEIRQSASPVYVNAAQISEIELYPPKVH